MVELPGLGQKWYTKGRWALPPHVAATFQLVGRLALLGWVG